MWRRHLPKITPTRIGCAWQQGNAWCGLGSTVSCLLSLGRCCGLTYFFFYSLTLQLFTALAYLHQNKFTHRDINPHNVYIDGDGNARLALAAVSKRVAEFVEAHDASVKELDGGMSISSTYMPC
jgi:serine/threonine protein kinase